MKRARIEKLLTLISLQLYSEALLNRKTRDSQLSWSK